MKIDGPIPATECLTYLARGDLFAAKSTAWNVIAEIYGLVATIPVGFQDSRATLGLLTSGSSCVKGVPPSG